MNLRDTIEQMSKNEYADFLTGSYTVPNKREIKRTCSFFKDDDNEMPNLSEFLCQSN